MTDLARVFARLAHDVAFADLLRTRPVEALRDYDLDTDELRRLDAALTKGLHLDDLFGRSSRTAEGAPE